MDIIVEKSTTIKIPEQPDINAPAYGIEYTEGEDYFFLEIAPDAGGVSIMLHLRAWMTLVDSVEKHIISSRLSPHT